MNDRTLERVRIAASNTNVATYRESAIVGGIVQCLERIGQFDHLLAAKIANENLKTFSELRHPMDARELIGYFSPVNGTEVTRAVRAFQDQYNPDAGVAA
jgi:hypothetical protein